MDWFDPIWTNLIQFGLIWSDLIQYDQSRKDLIQSDQKISKVQNLMINFDEYLSEFQFNQVWSILIQFDPSWSNLNLFDLILSDQKIDKVKSLIIWIYFNDYLHQKSILIKFDPFWSILVWSDSIWSKIDEVKNLIIYSNDYYIRFPIKSSLICFGQIWFNLIKE